MSSSIFEYLSYRLGVLKVILMLGLHYVPGIHGGHGSQKRSSPWCF